VLIQINRPASKTQVFRPISYTLGVAIFLFTNAAKVEVGIWVGRVPKPETTIPVSFHSQKFATNQLQYPRHECELLAIVDIVKTFQSILYDTIFTIVTDNKSSSYFIKQTTIGKQLTREKMFL
jgi:hypothetical protein